MGSVMDPAIKISLIILTLVVALVMGLFLRRKLVGRLKRTILDKWVVQTLGVLIVVPTLIIAAILIPIIYIWDAHQIWLWWYSVKDTPFIINLPNLLGNLIQTALLVALGLGIARTAKKITMSQLSERIDSNIRMLFGRIFYFLILALATFWILSIWQIQVGVPVAALSIVTVAITFAVQDILKDLVAGFYILVERPFYIGDMITIATYTGTVEHVQLRATKLRIVSGEEVRVPNSLVFTGIVINNSYYPDRRAAIAVCVADEDFSKEETMGQILQTVKNIEGVQPKPEPEVFLSSCAEQKITLTVRFWIASNQPAIVSDVMHTLYTALPKASIAVKEFSGSA